MQNASAEALLDGFNAPLGTFSSRIAACHALGLISEAEFRECQIFRRARNRFAHEIHITFADQAVMDLSNNLTGAIREEGIEFSVRTGSRRRALFSSPIS